MIVIIFFKVVFIFKIFFFVMFLVDDKIELIGRILIFIYIGGVLNFSVFCLLEVYVGYNRSLI